MSIPAPLSPRLRRAINTAATVHRDQVRKGGGIPYISHLYAVMHLLATVSDDEDLLIAGLLHDTLEDVPEHYSAARMEAEFGPRVRALVEEVTKEDLPGWQERVDAYLARLGHRASPEAVLLSVADKTHNLMSVLDDHARIGERLWGRFNAGKERQRWWYRSIAEVAQERLGEHPLVRQLRDLVGELERL